MATHNQNKHSISTGSSLIVYFLYIGAVAVCVALSHFIFGTWGVM